MIELLSDTAKVILALLGALVALGAYFIRKHSALVETLDREAVRKRDLEIKHEENSKALEDINRTVQHTHERLEVLGVLVHRMQIAEKNVQDLRDFKHEMCEPAVRYLDFLKTEKPWEEVVTRSEDHLARIESKIDAYEERAANTRHDIRNTVQQLTAEVATIKAERKSRNER